MNENNSKLKLEIKSVEVKIFFKTVLYQNVQNFSSQKSIECERKKENIGILTSKISRCGVGNVYLIWS